MFLFELVNYESTMLFKISIYCGSFIHVPDIKSYQIQIFSSHPTTMYKLICPEFFIKRHESYPLVTTNISIRVSIPWTLGYSF